MISLLKIPLQSVKILQCLQNITAEKEEPSSSFIHIHRGNPMNGMKDFILLACKD